MKLCNDNLCEFLYALDVGNSGDGKTAREVLTVIFKSSSYKDLVDNLQNSYLDPATKLVPKAKLTPETAVYWSNLAKYLHDESETQVHKLHVIWFTRVFSKYPVLSEPLSNLMKSSTTQNPNIHEPSL